MDFSTQTKGFLPSKTVTELPKLFRKSGFYPGLEQVVNSLTVEASELNLNFRYMVAKLNNDYQERVPLDSLSFEEIRYLHSLATFACHKYMWQAGLKTPPKLPEILAHLWVDTGDVLGLPPVLTYAGSVLYNWKFTKDYDATVSTSSTLSMDNVKCIFSFTGTEDEDNFFKVMSCIEEEGKHIIQSYESIQKRTCDIVEDLHKISDALLRAFNILKEFGTKYKCDPTFFYHTLRKYLTGYSDKDMFPRGFTIDGQVYTCSGGSGGQSALFYFLDMIFDIKHFGHEKKFFEKSLEMMPISHKIYLDRARKRGPIKKLIDAIDDDSKTQVIKAYNNCLKILKRFRSHHVGFIHKYIKKQNPAEQFGTQRSSLDTFLENVIDSTRKSMITPNDSTLKSMIMPNDSTSVRKRQLGNLTSINAQLDNDLNLTVRDMPLTGTIKFYIPHIFYVTYMSIMVWWIWCNW